MKPTHAWESDEKLSSAAAARILGVHPQTLRLYEHDGKIAAFRTPGGHRRYRRGDVEALARGESPALADTSKAVTS